MKRLQPPAIVALVLALTGALRAAEPSEKLQTQVAALFATAKAERLGQVELPAVGAAVRADAVSCSGCGCASGKICKNGGQNCDCQASGQTSQAQSQVATAVAALDQPAFSVGCPGGVCPLPAASVGIWRPTPAPAPAAAPVAAAPVAYQVVTETPIFYQTRTLFPRIGYTLQAGRASGGCANGKCFR